MPRFSFCIRNVAPRRTARRAGHARLRCRPLAEALEKARVIMRRRRRYSRPGHGLSQNLPQYAISPMCGGSTSVGGIGFRAPASISSLATRDARPVENPLQQAPTARHTSRRRRTSHSAKNILKVGGVVTATLGAAGPDWDGLRSGGRDVHREKAAERGTPPSGIERRFGCAGVGGFGGPAVSSFAAGKIRRAAWFWPSSMFDGPAGRFQHRGDGRATKDLFVFPLAEMRFNDEGPVGKAQAGQLSRRKWGKEDHLDYSGINAGSGCRERRGPNWGAPADRTTKRSGTCSRCAGYCARRFPGSTRQTSHGFSNQPGIAAFRPMQAFAARKRSRRASQYDELHQPRGRSPALRA